MIDVHQRIVERALISLDLFRLGEPRQLAYLAEFEQTQFLSPGELEVLQLERMKRPV